MLSFFQGIRFHFPKWNGSFEHAIISLPHNMLLEIVKAFDLPGKFGEQQHCTRE
jgi:hypothetical protein